MPKDAGRANDGRDRGIASRWLPAVNPMAEPPKREAPWAIFGVLALILGAVIAVAVRVTSIRVGLPVALALLASFFFVRAARHAIYNRRAADGRGLVVRSGSLVFHDDDRISSPLLDLREPYGVTLVAGPGRDRLIALLSSAGGMFYVGADLPEGTSSRERLAPLAKQAITVLGDDAVLATLGPDGQPLLLDADDFAVLLRALVQRSPACLERVVLTDTRGGLLHLDGPALHAGGRTVDLTAPLEWRPIIFQEAFGQAVFVYQGTWIRQGVTELVLVSPLPSLAPPSPAEISALDRAALRDLRLMQAMPDLPPPSEQRIAIDRLFMVPMRSALDRAPRIARHPKRAEA